jgi:NADP-dependent 3-hydroxy acid dehydrogenase YdfG
MSSNAKVVLITGASSGMGEAAAVRFARDGAMVALAARRQNRLEEVAEQVRQAGGEPLTCVTDVAELDQVRNMVTRTMEAFGRLDVVFNNAGLMRTAPIDQMSPEDIEQQIKVNFLGATWVLREVVPIMKKQDAGLIINVSSVAGRKVRGNVAVYCGTKWAVNAVNDAVREELLGTKVRICSIQPGVVDTHLFDTFDVHPAERMGISNPVKPAEVADLLAYIAELPWYFNINEVLFRPTEQSM